MQHRTRDEHLFNPGPKRILALDGGGIRGIFTVQILRKIEGIVRDRTQNPTACLADYFDLIGGTSTGSIIATFLAMGWSVDEIEKLYHELGQQIFKPSFFRKGLFSSKFSAAPLRSALKRELGEICIGGPELTTGLAIMAKRMDTGSPWIIHNNPKGKYFGALSKDSESTPNKDYLLRKVIRASTAAPHFFQPESIEVAKGMTGAFVDGGVSPHNNPALQLLLMATLQGYRLNWPTGADNLLLVSVGTGSKTFSMHPLDVEGMVPAQLALEALQSLMDDASVLNELMLQWLSRSPTARSLDGEVGDLSADVLGNREPWLSYLRYNVELEATWIKENLGIEFTEKEINLLKTMDQPETMESLVKLGDATAEKFVTADHFPAAFDLV